MTHEMKLAQQPLGTANEERFRAEQLARRLDALSEAAEEHWRSDARAFACALLHRGAPLAEIATAAAGLADDMAERRRASQ